jgi:hypothetical protein
VDGYFANLIRVRTARAVGWFLDFVFLLEFQSNVTVGNWTRSLRQVKSGMASTEFSPIARAIIKFLAAHNVSTNSSGFSRQVCPQSSSEVSS